MLSGDSHISQSIQDARVQYIFDSILSELARTQTRRSSFRKHAPYFPRAVDGNRTFIYVETAYIAKWWAEATPAEQATFTKYVNNGQLELVSGGACADSSDGAAAPRRIVGRDVMFSGRRQRHPSGA